MEIKDIKELFYNDTYAGYTYYLGSEKQIAIFDNNYNLIALNPQDITEYNKWFGQKKYIKNILIT